MVSDLLAPLLGQNTLNLEASLNMGVYANFRQGNMNGFFSSADIGVSLLNIFNLKVYVEFTLINNAELNRCLNSIQSSSGCPAYEKTSLAQYMFDKLKFRSSMTEYEYKSALEWNRFLKFSLPTTFYFMSYIKAKAQIRFPLLPGLLDVKGYLNGFVAFPNPFKKIPSSLTLLKIVF